MTFTGYTDTEPFFILAIALILWLTILFANFAEAIAEGRGKAQAESLKQAKKDVIAHKVASVEDAELKKFSEVKSSELKKGDLVYVCANEQIPMDGDVSCLC